MSKEMLINAIDEEECRIAVIDDDELTELYIERASTGNQVGNVYKGRVTNIEPSIQAAFVDHGFPKNGFLHVSDVSPSYSGDSKGRPPIQNILKRGQEVIVQVTKEGIGTKGPSLTTYLSIAGRYLVLMPGFNRVGVSRKIEDDEERHKLREMLESLDRSKNMGVIVRTAGQNQPKREIQRDLNYLDRVWKMVSERIKSAKAPAEIYRESDLAVRTVRDIFTTDIRRIVIDDPEVTKRVRDFLQVTMPRHVKRVSAYEGRVPLFHKYGLEEQIAKIYARNVPLPSGGYLVIDQAEALVAIDVNSGRFRGSKNAEESAFKLNCEAAKEIVRQLRLRDLGGVVVMDFVDMRSEKHRRKVEDILRQELKKDRARSKTLKTSRFGLVEMTRQRVRPSKERSTFMDCPHCMGSGLIKTPESMSLDVMRQLALAAGQDNIHQVEITVHPSVGHYIHNRKRRALVRLEERSGKQIMVTSDATVGQEAATFHCQDERGIPVKFDPQEVARRQREQARKQEKDERKNQEDENKSKQDQEPKKKKRRRRKKKTDDEADGRKDEQSNDESQEQDKGDQKAEPEKEDATDEPSAPEESAQKKSSSRRRRSRRKKKPETGEKKNETADDQSPDTDPDKDKGKDASTDNKDAQDKDGQSDESGSSSGSRSKSRRRRSRRKKKSDSGDSTDGQDQAAKDSSD